MKSTPVSFERVDLNLFRVFDAIMSHRSVAAASRELGVTASTVSHALTRLRKLLDDELFEFSVDGGAYESVEQPQARATVAKAHSQALINAAGLAFAAGELTSSAVPEIAGIP